MTIDKKTAQTLAEKAGFTWLTTKDYGDELTAFANAVADLQREEDAKAFLEGWSALVEACAQRIRKEATD